MDLKFLIDYHDDENIQPKISILGKNSVMILWVVVVRIETTLPSDCNSRK